MSYRQIISSYLYIHLKGICLLVSQALLTCSLLAYGYIVLGNQREIKHVYFMCLSNGITPQPIALESCSNPQKTLQVLESAMKKILFFFVNDVISKVRFWPFWLMLPGLGPNF